MEFTKKALETSKVFVEKIHKLNIYRELSTVSFSDFPNNIHPGVNHSLIKSLDYAFKEREAFLTGFGLEKRDETILKGDKVALSFLMLQKMYKDNDKNQTGLIKINQDFFKIANIDFKETIREQSLVYIVSFIESYIFSICTLLYREGLADPKGNFSQGDFKHKIKKLKKLYDIDLQIDTKVRRLLDEAFSLRNCIVHNASRYENKYVESWPTREVKVNDPIKINEVFLEAIIQLSFDIIRKLLVCSNEIFYEKTQNNEAKALLDLYEIAGSGGILQGVSWDYFTESIMIKDNWLRTRLQKEGYLL